VLIRHADPAGDAAACAAIYAPSVTDAVISFEERPPSSAEFEQRIDRLSRTHQWLVAEDNGEVVGYAYCSPHRDRTAYQWAGEVSAYVAAGHQRRGLGRALYGALLPLLAGQGLYVACAGVTLPNPASVAMHEACGFVPVGVYRRIGFKFGAWHDVGWWQLQLRDPAELPTGPPGPPLRLA
jgi:L-amino acid N-acyltransferase YncA